MRTLVSALEELRDALSREARRSVIVLGAVIAALWLCVAGGVSAATREPAPAAYLLSFESCEREAPEPPRVVGPIEWPTIAMAPREDPFRKKRKPPPRARPRK